MATKLKSHRGAAKRFKQRGDGTAVHRQSFRAHMSTSKKSKRMRQLRNNKALHDADQESAKRLLNGS